MVALYTIVISFFLLLLVYPLAVGVAVFCAWVRKRRVIKDAPDSHELRQIDDRTDRWKNRLFIISIVIVFFLVAPFLALLAIF